MKRLVAFDLDGTLTASKQPLQSWMGDAIAALLAVIDVAIISGADWSRFGVQVTTRLPSGADVSRLWLMPTTGTRLFRHRGGRWQMDYAEIFGADEKRHILAAFDASLAASGFAPERSWGERIEDRGSQITFSALGQQAPIHAKEVWDPDHVKRKIIQAELKTRLPGLSINIAGATSIDVTRAGVDKGYALARLAEASGFPLEAMLFIGDAIFPGGNDYPAKAGGVDTVRVRDPEESFAVITAIIACQK